MDVLPLLIGLCTGALLATITWLWRLQRSRQQTHTLQALQEQTISHLEQQLSTLQANYQQLQQKQEDTQQAYTRSNTENNQLKTQLATQRKEITDLQAQFTKDFSLIAQRVLDKQSAKFTQQNKEQLDQLLSPLREQIHHFEKKVESTNKEQLSRHSALGEQIKGLKEMSTQLSEEATQLTQALKGDTKQQGNWGEIMLERILSGSGLRQGEEYVLQAHSTTTDGRRVQPDAVIYLPDNKHIIIDAKVSLLHYEEYIHATDKTTQARYERLHVQSIKQHIKGLSEKNYPAASDFTAPDFVLLFMPIEAAFGAAMTADKTLFNYAWDRQIVIVTPSTLLATLRTVASIWKQERQHTNALAIARESGKLYDKLVGFVGDLQSIEKNLQQSLAAYDSAANKLKYGRGNLISRAEKIRQLGADTMKSLPEEWIDHEQEK